MPTRRLTGAFYRRPVLTVAADLPGRVLCRRVAFGRVLRGAIVEVEAYGGEDDRASHARFGPTDRNRPMYAAGGRAYVYLIYGMHHCFNVVTGSAGLPEAVLVRAANPPTRVSASGPGRLCRAFEIDRTANECSLLGRDLWLEEGDPPPSSEILATPRVGVDYAGAWSRVPYRFVVRGHPCASGPKRLNR